MRTESIRIGPYQVLARIGAGGMGVVYRALDTRLGREVALKVLADVGRTDGGSIARFRQEARLAGALDHPNVLAVHDVGEHEGKPYLVTELLEGESLRERLSAARLVESGRLPIERVAAIALQIAQGLAAAHEKGIVHRDLKPDNLFLTRDGRVKILDFGIAKLLLPRETTLVEGVSLPCTTTGAVLGTVAYMSPEQVRGEELDARSDLFSFGCVLHEMSSGSRAFTGKTPIEIGAAILHDEPQPLPPEVPSRLARVAMHCLAKRREDRCQTARDLLSDLQEIAAGGTDASNQAPPRLERAPAQPEIDSARSGSRRVRFAAGLLALLAGAAALIWYVPRHPRVPHDADTIPDASIAVLPFLDMSPLKDQEYFSDGLAEEILDKLAQIDGLRVAGRTSSFSFKGKSEDVRSIGEKLNVSHLLEGSVRKEGNRVRIVAQLVNARDGFHLWSRTYDQEVTGIFAAQDEISGAVVEALQLRLGAGKKPRRHHVPKPEAHDEFLLGNRFVHLFTIQGYQRAAEAYQRATTIDPEYAEAWAGLANATRWAPTRDARTQEEDLTRAMQYAERSVMLDPALADGYAARASIRSLARWDWKGARADFLRALDLNPNDATSHLDYAEMVLAPLGRLSEAIAEVRKATGIDPLSATAWGQLGRLSISAGQLDAAREALVKSIRLAPEQMFAPSDLALILLLQKRPGEALEQIGRSPPFMGLRVCEAAVLHDLGRNDEAQRVVDDMIARGSENFGLQIAEVFAWLGRPDQAFAWLDRAYAKRDDGLLHHLKVSVYLRSLRQDPRYRALLEKLDLPLD